MIDGRVGSVLELGTSFYPDLSGPENIYLNGAIIRMKRAEIGRRFNDIVAFAEIETFLDSPVKGYSSGTYARLAFAVADHALDALTAPPCPKRANGLYPLNLLSARIERLIFKGYRLWIHRSTCFIRLN